MSKKIHFYIGIAAWIAALYLLICLLSYSSADITAVAANTRVLNWGGLFGAWVADILRHTFGFASFLLVPCFIYTALYLQSKCESFQLTQLLFSHFIMLFSGSTLSALLFNDFQEEAGGFLGFYFSEYFVRFLSFVPSVVLTIIINVLCLAFSGIGQLFPRIKVQKTTIPPRKALHAPEMESESEQENAVSPEDGSMFSLFKDLITREHVISDSLPIVKIERPPSNKKMPWITKTTVRSSRHYSEERVQTQQLPINPIDPIDPFPPTLDEFAVQPNSKSDSPILMKDIFPPKERRVAEPYSRGGSHSFFDGIAIDKRHLPVAPIEKTRGDDTSNGQYVIECAIPVEKAPLRPVVESVRIKSIETSTSEEVAFAAAAHREEISQEQPDYLSPRMQTEQAAVPIQLATAQIELDEPRIIDVGDDEDEDDYEDEIIAGEDDHRIVFGAYKITHYSIPTYNFKMTDASDENSWMDEIEKNSKLLVQTLKDFGIDARVVDVNRGPVITLYEIQIAAGIKVNRISALSDDIAMALAASRVRIVAPIPGKSAIGVEIPNRLRDMVTLGDILMTEEYRSCKMELKVALGKDILGKPIMLDLKRQPHLLIAGATGAGKSVCVNALVSSLVVNYDPNFVRFIMIDPKMVELQLYNGLPHQLTNVITEPDIAPKALKWAIFEMERRYRLLSELNTRDIERYNSKIRGFAGQSNLEVLPYIVIIVDELADLMMVAPKEMENYITRIAQKARAVGIHLVLATQRPSVDVITGIIKANFPARIAFQVAQKTDSRTIIDRNGAEKLLGKGDMLYLSPTSSFPVRIQGANVTEDEIMCLVKHAAQYGSPHHIDLDEPDNNFGSESEGGEDADDLFNEALKIVEETKKASASYLQRRLSIGYNRAARIIERMEELGYIGPQVGSKAREVYV